MVGEPPNLIAESLHTAADRDSSELAAASALQAAVTALARDEAENPNRDDIERIRAQIADNQFALARTLLAVGDLSGTRDEETNLRAVASIVGTASSPDEPVLWPTEMI